MKAADPARLYTIPLSLLSSPCPFPRFGSSTETRDNMIIIQDTQNKMCVLVQAQASQTQQAKTKSNRTNKSEPDASPPMYVKHIQIQTAFISASGYGVASVISPHLNILPPTFPAPPVPLLMPASSLEIAPLTPPHFRRSRHNLHNRHGFLRHHLRLFPSLLLECHIT